MNETYHQFNEALFQGLSHPFENPAVLANTDPSSTKLMDGATFSQTAPLTGQGSLIVQVTLAKGAIPVEGAKVTVSSTGEASTVLSEMITDKSGQTQRISLPAPQGSYSQAPGGVIRPYSIYDIKIEFPGYYTERAINVPIFDQVNSIQPVALVPLPEDGSQAGEITVDESAQGPSL